ncbi:MAG: SDR family oxidoreductase [Porphyromonadaceae bacterium]|nr:MAG: SDR family oxidoreductase [Porphyromonadaceae bacterium]
MKTLKDKTVWITGASSGIGEALALVCAREGANLVLTARREEELKRVAAQTGLPNEAIMILPADLYRYDQVQSLTDQVMARFGRIDVLFNNAGISSRALAIESPIEIDRKVMDIDYFSVIALTKAVLPRMIKQNSGHIVVTSSVMGKIGTPLRSAYAAAKHALHGFFDSIRQEVADYGINITLVCPGYIHTQVSVNAITPTGEKFNKMSRNQQKGIDPLVMASKMVKAVYKNKRELVYGGKEVLGIYLDRFSPGLLNRYLHMQHKKNSFAD